jgi:hypothetical protein
LTVAGVSQVDDLRLPRKIDGKWTPYNPADYQPYASRQRWFRTPNDAFMTANFHVAAGLLTKVLKIEPFAPFQLVLASTYSGAFHPTAEGQAAIADAVVSKARAVLAKYGEGADNDAYVSSVNPDDVPPPPVAEPGREIPDVKAVLTIPGPSAAPAVGSGTSDAKAIVEPSPDAPPVPVVSGPVARPDSGVSDAKVILAPSADAPPVAVVGAGTPSTGAAPPPGAVSAEPLPGVPMAPAVEVGGGATGAPAAGTALAPVSSHGASPAPVSEPMAKAVPTLPQEDKAATGALPEPTIQPFAPASKGAAGQ